MNHYTVIIARPDYISNGSADTYMAHVEADTVAKAQADAQQDAYDADMGPDVDDHYGDPQDYAIVAVFAGHISDISEL